MVSGCFGSVGLQVFDTVVWGEWTTLGRGMGGNPKLPLHEIGQLPMASPPIRGLNDLPMM